MLRGGRRRSAVIASAIVIGGLSWCGWRWWDVRRYRDTMAAVEDAMQTGRYATAARDLSALLARRPRSDSDRAGYLLGLCEKARGRLGEADSAWAAVPPDSPFGGRAVAARMDLLVEQGRLAQAERLIGRIADDLGPGGSALRMLLIPILVQEGRTDEASGLIEARWRSLEARGEGATEQAVNLARLHMELRWNVPPVEAVREYLDQVGRLAPDDERIWLGRANLAIRAGSFDEAKRWIDRCLERHPDDVPTWRARLDWAMRTKQPDEVHAALEHLPADSLTPADAHRISAWMASARGDVERERQELAALIAEAPEDLAALDQLEALKLKLKQVSARGSGEGIQQRKAEIERDRARYRELHRRNQPARDAEEMARLAERLGHRFEATVFLNAAAAEDPDREDLRAKLLELERSERSRVGAGPGLPERLPMPDQGNAPSSDAS